jgi:hypothetical protein
MKIVATDTFFPSLKRYLVDRFKFWKYAFWEDKYFEIKWSVWALCKYFKIVLKMRPWDGGYIYEMTKFQLELLLPRIEHGHEEEVSRDKKVNDIKRLIELLNSHIEEDYPDRCGVNHDYDFVFKEDGEGRYLLETNETEEQKANNEIATKASWELAKKEKKEIDKLMSKIPTWWD